MNVSVALVMQVVEAQGLDRMAAFNMAGTDQLYYKEAGSVAELNKHIEMCEASIDGPYRLEVWKGQKSRGARAAGHPEYKFILAGRNGQRGATADPRLDRLIELLEKEHAEPAEAVSGLSPAVNEQLVQLAIQGLSKFLGMPAPAAALPAAQVAAQAVTGPVADMSKAEAMELLTMVAKYRSDNPSEYEQMRAVLAAKYPPGNGAS